MKRNYLIYILILIILGFLALVGWSLFKKESNSPISTSADTVTPKKTKPEPTYPKIEKYQIPILMYHYIRDASGEDELGKNLSVDPATFDAQVKWMKDAGYVSIKMSDLADPEKKEISKIYYDKKKPIVLTFDDGYEDAYANALPILQKYEFSGTFYIIRDYVGRSEYMNQDQIEKMVKAGMEIGSHSLSHPNLANSSEATQKAQISESKDKATSFCYPAGKFNDTTVSLVEEAGYTTAVTTKGGVADETSNLFELPRVRVENFSASVLENKIKNYEK